jgi:hypothetical protein
LCGVFLDLKKAFDVCSHEILLKKLQHLGVQNIALDWFKSYLSNRHQIVDINGQISSLKSIVISVLQGSILGPLLFLCYINDLPRATNLFSLLFADATAAFKSGKNLHELVEQVNVELNKMAVWFKANKLMINGSKTKYIIFRAKNKRIDPNIPKIVLNLNDADQPQNVNNITELERIHENHPDQNKRSYKLLGVYLDEFMNFNHHVDYVCSKLTKSLFCISRAKNLLSKKLLKLLYYALFHSHLNYCAVLLSGTCEKNISRISLLQKRAIRIINKVGYNDHTEPLFLSNNILTFKQIKYFNSMLFMHSDTYNYAPQSFVNMWTTNNGTRYDLRNNDDLRIPVPRIELFRKSFIYQLPVMWNNLGAVKYHINKFTFKIELKREILTEAVIN